MIYPIAVILALSSLDTVKSEIQWKTVLLDAMGSQGQTAIPHSFERTAIQIKTDLNDYKKNNRNAKLIVDFYAGKEKQGGLIVNLIQDQQDTYKINNCQTGLTPFPANMPSTETAKLWSILVTTGAQPSIKVQVNGVEVINLLISDDTCAYSNWKNYWTEEIDLLGFNSWQGGFSGYHLDSCYWGHYLDADADCQECPADHWSADAGDTACTPCPAGTHVGAGLGLAESDCTENGDETDGDETDGDETKSEHKYSQSVAHKLSALLVVLLFALNMTI
ncbi:uncharacterized protein LOC134819681 [Bolinopsis microptera]|uniref:uncharacterized protein LOC134819681 n=1 Tax=Bolinopsis microptera TaxID=2820187 RepID=UPI0030794017